MYTGTLPAIVTPFDTTPARAVDYKSYGELLEWLLTFPLGGVVVCGSTGEAATLTADERIRLIKLSREIIRGRVPLIAGTGTNSTEESVQLTIAAKAAGADGALAVAPYYNKPSQDGLFEHYRAIAERGGLPVTVYNIPGRSVVEILPDTMRRIGALPGVVALKHAVDSSSRLLEIAQACEATEVDLFAGDDPLTFAVMSLGGAGVISASASVIPGEMSAITEAMRRGDTAAGLRAQQAALPVINALFCETNPVPAKAALKIMGKIATDAVRLPLVSATPRAREILEPLFVGRK